MADRSAGMMLAGAGLAAVCLALVGCDAVPPLPPGTATATVSPSSTPPESVTSPTTVNHHVPSGEKVVGSLDNQTATMSLGQFSVESKFIKVYLTCFGPGEVLINVDGVGKFPLPCNQNDVVPSENQFEVSHLKSYSVGIESAVGQRWAATLAIPKA